MDYTMYRFNDPTGGGDDILVIAPDWAEVPGVFQARDGDGEIFEFQGDVEDEGEFKSGNQVRFP